MSHYCFHDGVRSIKTHRFHVQRVVFPYACHFHAFALQHTTHPESNLAQTIPLTIHIQITKPMWLFIIYKETISVDG